jgi:hypothetical protein
VSERAPSVSGTERFPVTPDGRYSVVRGKLWRRANPALPEDTRKCLVQELMAARRAIAAAKHGFQPAPGEKHALCRMVRSANASARGGKSCWTAVVATP